MNKKNIVLILFCLNSAFVTAMKRQREKEIPTHTLLHLINDAHSQTVQEAWQIDMSRAKEREYLYRQLERAEQKEDTRIADNIRLQLNFLNQLYSIKQQRPANL
jgi:hypothetical protein